MNNKPTWVDTEVELALKDCECDYTALCIKSALKAYKALQSDEHSGFSIQLTKEYLNRMIDGIPLTPITEDDEFVFAFEQPNGNQKYQCTRRTSLFKTVTPDGKISYSDNARVICSSSTGSYCMHCGRATHIIDKMFPITLPYEPTYNPYRMHHEDYLVHKENKRYTDWDIEMFGDIICPTGETIEHFVAYKYDMDPITHKETATEISKEEFEHLKAEALQA